MCIIETLSMLDFFIGRYNNILLLLHTIQLALTFHAFFPVHATLYINIVFIFGVNLVHGVCTC